MNKKQARDRAKLDVSCLDVGGFALVRQSMGSEMYDFVPVGGPSSIPNCSPLVVERWCRNLATNKWEKKW